MATIMRFEELEVWKNSRKLCKEIRVICDTTSLGKDFSIRNQILGSSGSCMDNIAEGFERDGNKECLNLSAIISNFIKYLSKSGIAGRKKKP